MKNADRVLLTTFFAAFFIASPLAFAEESSRITPNDIHALTLPEGIIRMQLLGEEYVEKGQFLDAEYTGDLIGTEYSEQILSLEVSMGLPHNWELGIVVPYADSSYDETDMDGNPVYGDGDDGLGNVRALAKYGIQMPEKSVDMLADLSVGTPTDSRKDGVKAGGDANLSFIVERYWDRLSVSTLIAANYRAEKDFSGGDVTEAFQLGLGYSVTSGLYASVSATRDDDFEYFEMSASYRFAARSSIEVFSAQDLSSDQDIKFHGVSLSHLL